MKVVLSILIIICSTKSFAQNKLTRINDPNGHTNIQSGPGVEFHTITTLNGEDLFYCEDTNYEWLKIIVLKWEKGKQIEGYIHRSKVQFINYLDNKTKQELLNKTLLKQIELTTDFGNACKNKDSITYRKSIKELEEFGELKYSLIIEILPEYFCKTKDADILQLFISTLIEDVGLTNEMPACIIGECFICKPSLVLTHVKNLKTIEQKNLIFDNIEWGLINYYGVDDIEKSQNKDFNRLMTFLLKEKRLSSR